MPCTRSNYENRALRVQTEQVQGYLQRCVFDDAVSLDQMLARAATGDYLAACRHQDEWRFAQRVFLIFIHP